MNDVNALRQHLFETIRAVKNGTISVEQARAVSDIGRTIISTAKAEIDYCNATGNTVSSDFIKTDAEQKQLPSGILRITTHKMGG